MNDVSIRSSTIEGGVAGHGGDGGPGAQGGQGGDGGGGAEGVSTFVDTAGAGGGGGGGGAGGEGGQGGGGAGGRSIGLLTTGSGAIEVIGSGSVVAWAETAARAVLAVGEVSPAPAARASSAAAVVAGCERDGPSGADGAPAVGGDSIGWWDQGNWSRSIDDTTIEAGTPGRGGPAARRPPRSTPRSDSRPLRALVAESAGPVR